MESRVALKPEASYSASKEFATGLHPEIFEPFVVPLPPLGLKNIL
jgi:hypothetical protein